MELLAGPYTAAAVLLALAGAPKVLRPSPAVRALRATGLPGSPLAVRLLGAGETGVAVAALTVGGRIPAALVAVSYLAFAGFVALALTRGGVVSSCGCFGKPDTPPTIGHIVGNGIAAAVAAAVAVSPGPGLLQTALTSPAAAAPLLVLTGCCAWFAYLGLARLPALTAARSGA